MNIFYKYYLCSNIIIILRWTNFKTKIIVTLNFKRIYRFINYLFHTQQIDIIYHDMVLYIIITDKLKYTSLFIINDRDLLFSKWVFVYEFFTLIIGCLFCSNFYPTTIKKKQLVNNKLIIYNGNMWSIKQNLSSNMKYEILLSLVL